MAAEDNLSDLQFEVHPAGHTSHVYARHNGKQVGHLEYEHDGFVAGATVHPEYQRRGIATAMVRHMPIEPQFSEEGNTKAGSAWISHLNRGA